ncbi:MAG TPA: hypothetical protein VMR86_17990 [Myxococcota bacterium]|nr:hypothetical protein [Myxococcota bacterium]
MIRTLGIALALLSLAIPHTAAAGGGAPITAHQLSIKLKAISQDPNAPKGDERQDNVSANQKDVFQTCVGSPPTKTQGVYLFIDCGDPTTNMIAAIDTDPLFDTAVAIGSLEIDTEHGVTTSKNGIMTKVVVPVVVHLSCNGDTTHVDAPGIMTVKFSALGTSDSCPLSGSIQMVGAGVDPGPGDFIVNSGSSISIKNRSGSISSFPPILF